MNKATRYAPEVHERAVRLVFEHQGEHDSQWAAIGSGKAGAVHLGLSRQRVNSALQQLEPAGLLHADCGGATVRDLQGLRDYGCLPIWPRKQRAGQLSP
jgi:hypothetical protein